MKRFSNIILVAGIALAACLFTPAFADTPPATAPANNNPSLYSFVNMARVMHDCDACQTLRGDLEAKKKQFQSELATESQSLSAARQGFEKERATMDRAVAEKKWQDLEGKYAQADKMLKEKSDTWDRAASASSGHIKKAAVDIILGLSKERNYAAVFSQESVILAASEYDITDEVIKLLNQKVKKVDIDWTAQPKAAAPAKQ